VNFDFIFYDRNLYWRKKANVEIIFSGKNPDVDTSFLPDRDREEEENRLR